MRITRGGHRLAIQPPLGGGKGGGVLRALTPAPLPSDGRGGELLWGGVTQSGARSSLALVWVTLSGFLGMEVQDVPVCLGF